MSDFDKYDKYTQTAIDQEAELAGMLADMDGYMWITPKEWIERYQDRQDAGIKEVALFLERNGTTNLNSVDPTELGKCFVGGAYGNNLLNWRTMVSIDYALRDRIRLRRVTDQSSKSDEVLLWLKMLFITLFCARITDLGFREMMINDLKKYSLSAVAGSSTTRNFEDSLPSLTSTYSAGLQQNFFQSFGHPEDSQVDEPTLNRFMLSIGIDQNTDLIRAISAIDDFNFAVIGRLRHQIEFYGELMLQAYERVLLNHFSGLLENGKSKSRGLRVNGQYIETWKAVQDILHDSSDTGIYSGIMKLLPTTYNNHNWVVSECQPYDFGDSPRMPKQHNKKIHQPETI